ncbi:hypothetical protein U9M48_004129 [Paspalum notatum var. saurae]|uniref:Fe2OG dioxygenase domain-containing protein n=1 Tax=Paspalum notatum var. saurae TaxID=547442 RepID=A0AAQ3SIS8_PASNO
MATMAEDHQLQLQHATGITERDAAKSIPKPMFETESVDRAGDLDSKSQAQCSYSLIESLRQQRDRGITRMPDRYILPASDRPGDDLGTVKLPVVDVGRLRDRSQRASVLDTLDAACREYGFFQASTLQKVVNHGVERGVINGLLDVARQFFELPVERRGRYMSPDVRAPVRYGTSFNQAKDAVLFWRDFLKLACQPLHAAVASWPDEPADLREVAARYAMANHELFMELMEAALEALGIPRRRGLLGELAVGYSQLMLNCYPACPQPELALGLPPHSDYGLFTILLQGQVEGLQVMHHGRWLTVDPVPGSFTVNVGDHLEIYSNGRYKSMLHRVRVNSTQPRISVASFHSVPVERVIGPAPELVNEGNPPQYMDTDYATFLAYLASTGVKHKSFLQSRKLAS